MNLLNIAITRFFKILQASRSSFVARTLLGALALSKAILPTGWPDDYHMSDGDYFDFIVVGAGSAGAVVAARLAEIPSLKVLLIEAGGNPPPTSVIPSVFATLAGTEYDWNYQGMYDEGIGNARIEHNAPYQRGKVLGGSSAVNYLVHTRGVPQDYDDWNIVAPGWDWNNVLYYMKKLERMTDPTVFTPENGYFHSKDGPVGVSRAESNPISEKVDKIVLDSFREIGIPTVLENSGPNLFGASRPHFIFENGRRSSTAEAYLRFKKNERPNLHIAKYTRATKVLIDPETLQAYGVEVLSSDGLKKNAFAKREVIVSAGSMDSPKLLKLSGIGPREELDRVGIPTLADLPVGKNMQDHLLVPMIFAGKEGFLSAFNNLVVTTQLDSFPVPFQSSYFRLNSIPSTPFDVRPQFQTFTFYVGAAASLILKAGCSGYGFNSAVCASLSNANNFREIFVYVLILLHPLSRGTVSLKSNNPLVDPLIDLGYLRHRQDTVNLIEGAKFLSGLANTTYFHKNGGYFVKLDIPECRRIQKDSDEYWDCYVRNMIGPMLHAVGTCKMGPTGVVDERLRVHGIGRLRVADASVMPEIPSGNTNTPTMMIGEKAADMIKEDFGFTYTNYIKIRARFK